MVTIVPVIPKRILVHVGHFLVMPLTRATMERTKHGRNMKRMAQPMIISKNTINHAKTNIPINAIILSSVSKSYTIKDKKLSKIFENTFIFIIKTAKI